MSTETSWGGVGLGFAEMPAALKAATARMGSWIVAFVHDLTFYGYVRGQAERFGSIESGSEMLSVGGTAAFRCSQRGEVGGQPLHIDQDARVGSDELNEVNEGNLGGIDAAMKHRLAGEESSESDTVKSTGQALVVPHLD